MFNLSRFLPFRLSVLSNTVSEQIATTYRDEFGLSVPQWRVMAVLHESPGLGATAVSSQTAMDKVAVSRAVSRLIDRNLIERQARTGDGRSSTLFLTPEGDTIYRAIVPKAAAFERELLENLSAEERAELDRLLTKLATRVSPNNDLW